MESPKPAPVRRTAIFGALAALGVAFSFFVDWVWVERDFAERAESKVEERLSDTSQPTVVRADDWRRLMRILVDSGSLNGLDVYFWARTSRAPETQNQRAIHVISIVLATLPVGGVLIALYFFVHRGRRARSPVLILCILIGTAAVVVSTTYEYVRGPIGHAVFPAWGLGSLRAFGAALALVGVFGVKGDNWWRVYGGTALTAGALALIAWHYVTAGFLS